MLGARAGTALALMGVAVLSVPSHAATGSATAPSSTTGGTRTVHQAYSAPAGASASLAQAPAVVANPMSPIQLQPREDHADLSVQDAGGAKVLLQVDYVPRGQRGTTRMTTCHPTLGLDVAPGSTLSAQPLAGRCPDGTLALPSSGTLTFHLVAPPIVRVTPPTKRWAVLVGLHTYARPTHDTIGGAGDTTAVRNALLHSGWRSDHILVVTDKAGTAAGLQNAMRWLASHSGPDTFSLFHYSGHICIASRGPCGSGHTWLWTTDNHFVPETTVGSLLRGIRGHAWIDIAGCEAGAFDVGVSSRDRLYTASSQAHETSYEKPEWHESIWAGLLWDQGYNRGQANGRPYSASIDTLWRFASGQATAMTADQPAGAQHPYKAGGFAGWTLTSPPS